jgi:hypothetical protein
MGTSRVWFRGRHFDALDPVLEVWLRLLVDEIDALDNAPDWLPAVRDDWQLLATEEFGFGVVPDLDGVLTDAVRRELLLQLSKRALKRLEAFGDPISAATLNALGAGKSGGGFPRDLPAHVFLEPARTFIRLLEDPSDSG